MTSSIHPAIGTAAAIAKGSAALRESVLSDFADYVHKQQLKQQYGKGETGEEEDGGGFTQDELNIIEQLGLADDDTPRVRTRELLLNRSDEYDELLAKEISDRLEEGKGETIFEVSAGEGDVVGFTKEQFDTAMGTIRDVATTKLDCAVTALIEQGAGEGSGPKGDGYSAMALIRRRPKSAKDLLEIRVAVVGNGRLLLP